LADPDKKRQPGRRKGALRVEEAVLLATPIIAEA
jgi:hypothetical protein